MTMHDNRGQARRAGGWMAPALLLAVVGCGRDGTAGPPAGPAPQVGAVQAQATGNAGREPSLRRAGPLAAGGPERNAASLPMPPLPPPRPAPVEGAGSGKLRAGTVPDAMPDETSAQAWQFGPPPAPTRDLAVGPSTASRRDAAARAAGPLPAFNPGSTAYGIEAVRCREPHEAFILVLRGEVESVENGVVFLRLSERYAASFDIRREGVSTTDRWCIPRRRICYESVEFADWGGRDRRGALRAIPAAASRQDDPRLLPQLIEHAVAAQCHLAP